MSYVYKTKMRPDPEAGAEKPKALIESDYREPVPAEIKVEPRDPEARPKAFRQTPAGRRIPL